MVDSHPRSIIKGITWRITGTIDTILVAFFVTSHIGNAFSIGLSELLTKVVLYYLHERLWQLIKWQRSDQGPSHVRSFVKGVTWRICGTIDTILLSYLITGHVENAFTIGGVELITKITLYYFHERIWANIKWGRLYPEKNPAVDVVKEEV